VRVPGAGSWRPARVPELLYSKPVFCRARGARSVLQQRAPATTRRPRRPATPADPAPLAHCAPAHREGGGNPAQPNLDDAGVMAMTLKSSPMYSDEQSRSYCRVISAACGSADSSFGSSDSSAMICAARRSGISACGRDRRQHTEIPRQQSARAKAGARAGSGMPNPVADSQRVQERGLRHRAVHQ